MKGLFDSCTACQANIDSCLKGVDFTNRSEDTILVVLIRRWGSQKYLLHCCWSEKKFRVWFKNNMGKFTITSCSFGAHFRNGYCTGYDKEKFQAHTYTSWTARWYYQWHISKIRIQQLDYFDGALSYVEMYVTKLSPSNRRFFRFLELDVGNLHSMLLLTSSEDMGRAIPYHLVP